MPINGPKLYTVLMELTEQQMAMMRSYSIRLDILRVITGLNLKEVDGDQKSTIITTI